MKLNCLPLAALVAISSAVDTTVVNSGVKYEILGALIQVRPTLEAGGTPVSLARCFVGAENRS